MRGTNWIKSALMVAALGVIGAQARGQQDAQAGQQTSDEMVQAAKKAREAKKNAPKPKRVLTDDDVEHRAPETAAAGEKSAAGEEQKKAEQKTEGEDTTKDDPNGEKAWRKRFATQHEKISKAEMELDVLQREVEKGQVQYYPDPQKAMMEQNNRAELNTKTAKIEEKKKDIARLKQELETMELDLKRAGGDPGWAR